MLNDVVLLFAGDFLPPDISESIYTDELVSVLNNKDYSNVNLEAPITKSADKIHKTGNYFKIHPSTITQIKNGFFDSVALSNNHIRDYGNQGINETINSCTLNEIDFVGAGINLERARVPLRKNIKGKKISIFNYCQYEFSVATEFNAGANPYNPISAYYDIEYEKKHSDIIIVIYHGGIEYHHYPLVEHIQNFKYLIDIGVDAIITHHSHYYSGVIRYKSRPIFCGLGSFFLRPQIKNPHIGWNKGVIVKLFFRKNGQIDWELIPTVQDFNKVRIANVKEKEIILTDIEKISKVLNNSKELNLYWENEFIKIQHKQTSLLLSNSRRGFLFRKHFPFFKPKMSRFKILSLLNTLRCETHRSRTIAILEGLYKKMN